ncbi:MAG: hypothetical protein LBC78_01010, partial [Oscillospiraceae bacterium]|nr:hypothetical protein [Oscillospiraceae bacterium]
MMLRLLKINLAALLSALSNRQRRGLRGKISPIGGKAGIAALLVFVFAAFLIMFGGLFLSICDAYYSMGLGWLYFAMEAGLVFSLCVITCIFSAQSAVF